MSQPDWQFVGNIGDTSPRRVVTMIGSRALIQLENKILREKGTPRHVIGWRLVGSSYRRGHKMPGYTHLLLNGGGWVWYPEDKPLADCFADAESLGYDCTQARADLTEWVATGKGARFSLESPDGEDR